MLTTIAIDPGAKGGVAFHNERDGIYEADNLYPLANLMNTITMLRHEDFQIHMVIEDVPPYTGNAIPGSRSFKMGVSYGMLQGLALGERIPCFKISPKDWQKNLPGIKGLKGNERKKVLKDICVRLYPNLSPTLNTCDAILMLHKFINKETNPK